MLTKNISLKSFLRKGGEKKIKERFKSILIEKNELFNSMSKNYNDSFNSQRIKKICSKKRLFFNYFEILSRSQNIIDKY